MGLSKVVYTVNVQRFNEVQEDGTRTIVIEDLGGVIMEINEGEYPSMERMKETIKHCADSIVMNKETTLTDNEKGELFTTFHEFVE